MTSARRTLSFAPREGRARGGLEGRAEAVEGRGVAVGEGPFLVGFEGQREPGEEAAADLAIDDGAGRGALVEKGRRDSLCFRGEGEGALALADVVRLDPDLEGRVLGVPGGRGGVGLAFLEAAVGDGERFLVPGRVRDRGPEAVEEELAAAVGDGPEGDPGRVRGDGTGDDVFGPVAGADGPVGHVVEEAPAGGAVDAEPELGPGLRVVAADLDPGAELDRLSGELRAVETGPAEDGLAARRVGAVEPDAVVDRLGHPGPHPVVLPGDELSKDRRRDRPELVGGAASPESQSAIVGATGRKISSRAALSAAGSGASFTFPAA